MSASHRHIGSAPSGLGRILADARKTYLTARLWLAIAEQDTHWVPRGAWAAYREASLRTVAYQADDGTTRRTVLGVSADFAVPGVVTLDHMDLRWRRQASLFLWGHARGICAGMAWEPFVQLNGRGPYGDDFDDADRWDCWNDRLADETLRRAWFDELALVTALRASVEAELDARVAGGPVLLGPTSGGGVVPQRRVLSSGRVFGDASG